MFEVLTSRELRNFRQTEERMYACVRGPLFHRVHHSDFKQEDRPAQVGDVFSFWIVYRHYAAETETPIKCRGLKTFDRERAGDFVSAVEIAVARLQTGKPLLTRPSPRGIATVRKLGSIPKANLYGALDPGIGHGRRGTKVRNGASPAHPRQTKLCGAGLPRRIAVLISLTADGRDHCVLRVEERNTPSRR